MDSAIRQSDLAKHAVTLCMTCGLCCDGTLFSSTPISTDTQNDHDKDADVENGNQMSQPCMHHKIETGCQIYATRPNVCRNFKCRLLRSLLEGGTALDDAMAIVSVTKEQRAKVNEAIEARATFLEHLPLATRFSRVHSDNSDLSVAHDKENSELFWAYLGLIHLIKKYFLPNFKKNRVQSMTDTDAHELESL